MNRPIVEGVEMKTEVSDIGRTFMEERVLEHHGVKGMRWGVRRSQRSLDKAAGRSEGSSSSGSDDAPNAGRSGGSDSDSNKNTVNSRSPQKSVSEMSDKELKAYVNRLNMEQQFQRMQPTPLSKRAAKFAGEILVGVARQQLTNQLNSQLNAAITSSKANRDSVKAQSAARKAGVPDAPGRRTLSSPPRAEDRRG